MKNFVLKVKLIVNVEWLLVKNHLPIYLVVL